MKTFAFTIFLILSTALSAQNLIGNKEDINAILENISAFSEAVMSSDSEALGMAYSEDAKIFPNEKEIIRSREAITKYWIMPEGVSIKYHKITPEEIKVIRNEAYDYGIYEGTTQTADGKESSWKGKYVIVWKKINDEWKIYLDIWNRIALESAEEK